MFKSDDQLREKNANWKGFGRVGRTEYNSMVYNARMKGFEMRVSIEYLDKLLADQDCKCALTGLPLVVRKTKGNASVDRIDSSRGYIPGNVQWVDKRINIMKHRVSQAQFIELCGLVYLNYKESRNVDLTGISSGNSSGPSSGGEVPADSIRNGEET